MPRKLRLIFLLLSFFSVFTLVSVYFYPWLKVNLDISKRMVLEEAPKPESMETYVSQGQSLPLLTEKDLESYLSGFILDLYVEQGAWIVNEKTSQRQMTVLIDCGDKVTYVDEQGRIQPPVSTGDALRMSAVNDHVFGRCSDSKCTKLISNCTLVKNRAQ